MPRIGYSALHGVNPNLKKNYKNFTGNYNISTLKENYVKLFPDMVSQILLIYFYWGYVYVY